MQRMSGAKAWRRLGQLIAKGRINADANEQFHEYQGAMKYSDPTLFK